MNPADQSVLCLALLYSINGGLYTAQERKRAVALLARFGGFTKRRAEKVLTQSLQRYSDEERHTLGEIRLRPFV